MPTTPKRARWCDVNDAVALPKRLKTKAKIKKLARLLRDEMPTGKCPDYLAVDVAVAEAIAKREGTP